jgi:hypothetical protein
MKIFEEVVMRLIAVNAQVAFQKKPFAGLTLNPLPNGALQRAAMDRSPVQGVPPIVHDVLRAPGEPLDAETRAFMEPRFEQDFSNVRIHSDGKAAESARAINALAYTVGHDMIFDTGQYAPEVSAGRKLIAHELTHVIQQRQVGNVSPFSDDRLEAEAEHSAKMVGQGVKPQITQHPPAEVPQRYRKKIQGLDIEFGDVKLNAAASTDIRTHGNLLPSKDQGHIAVEGGTNNLGYDANYTNPEDPFRWEHLKDVVGKGSVDIQAVGISTSIPSKVEIDGKSQINQVSLAMFMASGLTLPTIPRQKAIDPSAKKYAGSNDDTRDKVYYETGKGGRGILGGNSLAHELFGHLWLALQGVPWAHGGQISAPGKGSATPTILDPLARTYSGSVDEYIGKFAGSSDKTIQSPTRFVGGSFLPDAKAWILKEGAKHLSWKNVKGQQQANADPDFAKRWEILSLNYEIMLVGQQNASPSSLSAPDLVQWVYGWYSNLTIDKQQIFTQILDGLTWGFSSGFRIELPRAVLDTIRNASRQKPATP